MKFTLKKVFIFCILGSSVILNLSISAQEQVKQENQSSQNSQESLTANGSQENKSQSQTTSASKPKPFADELNIADQFSYAIDKSSNFQDYKVIKQGWMTKLKANTLDTLLALKANLNTSKDLLKQKSETIENLRSELNNSQSELLKKNSFSFFGIMVSKAGYDTIMWSIIVGLVVGLGFMIAAFRRSFSVTVQIKKDLNEVKDEYENYRKKALKSKEDAVRQLYDELSKYKNKK